MALIFSYSDLSKGKAVTQIKKYFAKEGCEVVSVDVDAREKKVFGFTSRGLTLGFADSQRVSLRIKESGDVYEVTLNGKRTPIREQDDHKKAVAEIAEKLTSNRAAFQKRLAKKKAAPPKGIKATPKKALVAAQEKLDAINEELAEVQAAIAELKKVRAA